ncbi:MAG: branched-chain amino acid ABC transporter permease [Alphaproteobacteria bacterium]|nr:branched-chain amino acid ABC transporter permease [Alphaproteobacteria bacterium]
MLPFLLVSGLTTGALYALVAIGLVLVYRSTTHINFAHGELFMVGGFLAYTGVVILGWPYVPSLILAVIGTFILGIVSDRAIFRPLIHAPGLSMVLATVGFSFLLKGIGRLLWGGRGEFTSMPPIVDPSPIFLAGLPILPQQLVVLAAAVACMLALAAFFRGTTAGKSMQATAESTRASYLVGIRVERVYMYTWGAGAAIAAVAGCFMAPLTLLSPDIGFNLLLKAFAATILGGLGSMGGAVVGGFAVGIIESLAGGYVYTAFQDVSAFIVIIAVLVLRPQGLFGTRPAREA